MDTVIDAVSAGADSLLRAQLRFAEFANDLVTAVQPAAAWSPWVLYTMMALLAVGVVVVGIILIIVIQAASGVIRLARAFHDRPAVPDESSKGN